MEAPCKNCEKKGCGRYHAKCEVYQHFKEEYADLKAKMHDDSEIRYGIANTGKPTRLSVNSPLRGRKL